MCNIMKLLCCMFPRKEHKTHSPNCDFILLKKAVDSLTVEEFLKLQKERQKFIIVSMSMYRSGHVYFYRIQLQELYFTEAKDQ